MWLKVRMATIRFNIDTAITNPIYFVKYEYIEITI